MLKDISFTVAPGEMVALIGASGSGKSTLIRTIAGLISIDRPRASGRHTRRAHRHPRRDDAGERPHLPSATRLRARIGVIFQQFNLVPRLSVLTNVASACWQIPHRAALFGGSAAPSRTRHAGAGPRRHRRAGLKRGSELSGGQQQRAAIARTLVQGASVLIADEPIASLDPKAARRVMDILAELNRQDKITVLVSLHQVEYALSYCPRTIALRDGRIVYDGPSNALTPTFLSELYGAESEELFLPALTAEAGELANNGHAVESARVIAPGPTQRRCRRRLSQLVGILSRDAPR